MSSKAKSISGDSPFKPKRLTLSHYLPGQIRDVRSAAAFVAAAVVVAVAAAVVKGDGRQALYRQGPD